MIYIQIGKKISSGITVLLALFVNLLVVSEYKPEAATKLPILGWLIDLENL